MEILGIPKKLDPFEWKGKAMLVKSVQDLSESWDASGLCVFAMNVPLGPDFLAEQLTQATGIGFIPPVVALAGERIWNLQRIFNIRAGISSKDDTLPRRFLEEAPTKGPAKGKVVPLNKMLREYYELRGWDENGIPYPGKLSRLGLGEYIF
jgi:aldehyde:ferredoxin oxidoreductase